MTAPWRERVEATRPRSSPAGPKGAFPLETLLSRGAPLLLVALAAALSSFRLDAKGLWHDEAFTLAVASSDGETFWRSLTEGESFGGLYYLIVRLLPPLWENEASLRAPSVVFAVLTAITIYFLARRLFGVGVAVVSVLLLSFDFFFIRYAQEARAYALALWLVTLATFVLVRAVERPTWVRWLGYSALGALAVYAHFFAVLVLVGHVVSLLLHRSLVPWKKVVVAAGSCLVFVLPLAVVLLSTNAGGRPLLAQSSTSDLLRDLAGIAPTRSGVLQALIFALSGAAMLVIYLRQRRQGGEPAHLWHHTLVLCWLVIPIVLGAVISLMWPILVTRYFIVVLPALVMLIAVGLTIVRPAVQAALLVVVLVIAAQGLGVYYAQNHKEGENWRGLVQYVADEAQSGDRVLFLSHFGRRPFEYYLDRHAGLASSLTPVYPTMPWGSYAPVVGEAQVGDTSTWARDLEADEPARVWVVLLWGGFRTGDDDGAPFQRVLVRHYVETDHVFFGRYLKLGLFEHR
jgi:mannosyltransferase